MDSPAAYSPFEIFVPGGADTAAPVRVFLAPQRYVQGPGVLDSIGRYLSLLNARQVAVLISKRGESSEGPRLLASLAAAGITTRMCHFGGECSLEEIASHTSALGDNRPDALLAVGGGKCVDAGKGIAYRLGVPVVVIPTLASNDAPCSALSVIYTPEGVSAGVEFYPCNPALVVVDTAIVAAAPPRYLVAGMGDAMATFYEARVCLQNKAAMTTVGARPTLAAVAIGQSCAETLFAQGLAALEAVARGEVDEALEQVVEANTLLSGIGFESGGLAAAHGVAQACTAIASAHANHLHGEMVAIGTLTQLVLESRPDEARRVAEFFARVGLPVHLGQVSIDSTDAAALGTLIEGTLGFPYIGNLPFAVNAANVRQALLDADALGHSIAGLIGDAAYRQLHR